MIIQELRDKGLISPPNWLPTNTIYLTLMGSSSYGTSIETSDFDVYGITIPPKKDVSRSPEAENLSSEVREKKIPGVYKSRSNRSPAS